MANFSSLNNYFEFTRQRGPSERDLQRREERAENARKRTLQMQRELEEELAEIERLEREESQRAQPGGRFRQRRQQRSEIPQPAPIRLEMGTAPPASRREEERETPQLDPPRKRRRRGKKGRSTAVFDPEPANRASQDPPPAPSENRQHSPAHAPWADNIWVKVGNPSPFGGDRWSEKPCKFFWGPAHHCDKGVDCEGSHDDPYQYQALINEYSEVYQNSWAKEAHDLWKRDKHLTPTWERQHN